MRFAFYVSARAGRLCKFLQQCSDEHARQVVLVLSDSVVVPEARMLFERRGIKLLELPFDTIEGANRKERNLKLSDWIFKQLRENQIDYCFSNGSHILTGELLVSYQYRLINFHPALLPMFPGLSAIDQAVAHGNTLLVGNTAHFIDAGVDTGKIIMQSAIPLKAFKDAGNDYNVIMDLQVEMLNRLFRVIIENRLVVEDGVPRIKGADYSRHAFYPEV